MNTNQNVALSEESEQIRSWHKRSYENLKSLEGNPMTTNDHPLTEARAAELWDAYREPEAAPLHEQGRIFGQIQIAMLRAAYDADREHEHTQARTAEVTDEMVAVAIRTWFGTDTGVQEFDMRAALSAALAVATPTDPHHDARPWQACTHKDIRKGDLVEAQCGDYLRTGVAHHQDSYGDWATEDDFPLSYDPRWPLRRIPAPTPPAEEVELPTTDGAVIIPAEGHEFIKTNCGMCQFVMILNADGRWYGGAEAVAPEDIVPGTWKVARND